MNKEELELILKEGEKQFIEFKENFNEEVIETLVAFSNFKGGKIILGVNDKKEIKGVSLGKESLKNWMNEIKNKTEPFITPEIETFEIENKKIVVIEIIEFPLKPVSIKGVVYIRKNNGNVKLSAKEISEIYLRTKNSSWDFYIKEEVSREDLDENKISKTRKMIENNLGVDLMNNDNFLKKYDLINNRGVSNGAYLLFSKKELRQTDIQIGLFSDPTIIKKSKLIRTDLFSEVEEVMDFIEAYILREYIITGKPQREERWQYPLKAIREFVINSIIHKDYQDALHTQIKVYLDKIEIFNIGKLPYDVELKDVLSGKEKSHPRNKLIAEVFRDANYIERYGSGISRALKDFKEYGLVMPEIKNKSGGFEVIVFDKKLDGSITLQAVEKTREKTREKDDLISTEKVTENQKLIIELIKENKFITYDKLFIKLNKNRTTIMRNISKLKKQGKLERVGSDKEGHWKVIE